MNKIFSKVFFDNLKNIFNKTASLNQSNFIKNRLTWILIPIVGLALLISGFMFNCYTKKFDIAAMINGNKTIIEIPLKDGIDSNTLKRIQNSATKLLKSNCVAQESIDYDKHMNSVLGKDGLNMLKITAFQSDNLTDQQKKLLFDELNQKFSNVVDLEDVDENINSYTLSNLETNSQFWIQLLVVGSILFVCFIAYYAIKFKKLGLISIFLAATTDLILSLGITFFTTTLLTKKINLIFIMAMAIYFANNTASLFSKIAKESENETDPYKIANSVINKNLPNALFTLFIVSIASISALIANIIFDNPLLFYLAISTLIGVVVNLFLSTFFSPQLWALMRNKTINKKGDKPSPVQV